jgi:hypothetical protein
MKLVPAKMVSDLQRSRDERLREKAEKKQAKALSRPKPDEAEVLGQEADGSTPGDLDKAFSSALFAGKLPWDLFEEPLFQDAIDQLIITVLSGAMTVYPLPSRGKVSKLLSSIHESATTEQKEKIVKGSRGSLKIDSWTNLNGELLANVIYVIPSTGFEVSVAVANIGSGTVDGPARSALLADGCQKVRAAGGTPCGKLVDSLGNASTASQGLLEADEPLVASCSINCFMAAVNTYAKGVCTQIGPVAEVVEWCKGVMHEVRAKPEVRDAFNQAQKLPQFAEFHKRHGNQVVGVRKPEERRAATLCCLVVQTDNLQDILSYVAGDPLVVKESQTFVKLMEDEDMKTRCTALRPVAKAIWMTNTFCASIDEGLGLVKSRWDKMLKATDALVKTWDLTKPDELHTLEKHLKQVMFTPIVALATFLHPVNLNIYMGTDKVSVHCMKELRQLFDTFFTNSVEKRAAVDRELTFLLDRQGTFGEPMCWVNAGTAKKPVMPPSQWWASYGVEVPCLRELGLHCSGLSKNASGSECVWGDADRAYRGWQNRLGTDTIEKAVCVAGALRNMRKKRKGVQIPLPTEWIWDEEDQEVALTAEAQGRERAAVRQSASEAELFGGPPAGVTPADAFQLIRKRKYPSATDKEEQAAALYTTSLAQSRVDLEVNGQGQFLSHVTALPIFQELIGTPVTPNTLARSGLTLEVGRYMAHPNLEIKTYAQQITKAWKKQFRRCKKTTESRITPGQSAA